MHQRLEENVILKIALIFLTDFGLKSLLSFQNQNFNSDEGNNFNFNGHDETGFTINTSGCSIPKMKVRDFSLKNLVHFPKDIPFCRNNLQPLLQSNQTHIWTVKEHLKYYQIADESRLKCCYRSFHRSSAPNATQNLLHKVVYLDCIIFSDVIEAANEFVKVECYYNNAMVYKQFFVFIPKKPFSEQRKHPFEISNDKPTFNVIIMGLSSMSRLNTHRAMPNTFNLLTELGAIELLGYHGMADNDNILPVLAGMTTADMNFICMPTSEPILDRCHFIWERFKDIGHYTALIQDTTSAIFDSNKWLGFNENPTDYYLQLFMQESEINEIPVLNNIRMRNTIWNYWKNPNMSLKSVPVCMGGKYYFRVILEYIERLSSLLKTSKLFGVFWESKISQRLNVPMIMDHGYEALIRKLNETGYLNETILILLSDHGTSRGGIHATKQGRLEQRLPLAAILMPPAFREQYSVAFENLKINSKRLTTPFDLHETLVDLIDLDAVENNEVIRRSKCKLLTQRGMSLFVPIHSNRTCKSAGIEDTWCTCHQRRNVNVTSLISRNAAKFVVNHLNWLLNLYPQCAKFEVDQVLECEEMFPSYANEYEWREFAIKVRLKPGAGEFEALLRLDVSGWSLMAHVRRLDLYKHPSHCFADGLIKGYCYCSH